MAYVLNSGRASTSASGVVIALKSGITSSLALVKLIFSSSDSGALLTGRFELNRYSIAGSGINTTPEKTTTRSGTANAVLTLSDGVTNPTKVGNALVLLPQRVTAAAGCDQVRVWRPPNLRYPVYILDNEANGFYIDSSFSSGAVQDYTVAIEEPLPDIPRHVRGRRASKRGNFHIKDNLGGFMGVSTLPMAPQMCGEDISFTQAFDWLGDIVHWNINLFGAASGNLFFQNVDGSCTPVGDITKLTFKNFVGSVTPNGTLAKLTSKFFAGSSTATGALTKLTSKFFSGSSTSSGTLAESIVKVLSLSGSVTATGTLVKLTLKALAGSVTAAGTLIKQVQKSLAGSVTASGTLVKFTSKLLAGSVTTVGTLVENLRTSKSISGSSTPFGTLVGVIIHAGGSVKRWLQVKLRAGLKRGW